MPQLKDIRVSMPAYIALITVACSGIITFAGVYFQLVELQTLALGMVLGLLPATWEEATRG